MEFKEHDPFHRFTFIDDTGKLHAYHFVESKRGLILFDTGKHSTPTNELRQALAHYGHEPNDVILVLFTHADADHIGGNRVLRELNPDVMFGAHESDVPFIENKDYIIEHRYRQFEEYGVFYDNSVHDLIDSMMETDEPVDFRLSGGESFYLNHSAQIRAIHLPGHSPGHLGFYYSGSPSVLMAGDAVYPEGAFTVDGDPIQPPPYENLQSYRFTIDRIKQLNPDLLLLSHFEPLHDSDVNQFLDRAKDWISEFHRFFVDFMTNQTKSANVPEIIDQYTESHASVGLEEDLAYATVSHLEYCRQSHVYEVQNDRSDKIPRFSIGVRTSKKHDSLYKG